MKVSVEEVGSCKRSLLIEIPEQEVQAKMEEAFQNLSRNLVLPGFRKGRVPRELIVRRFREEVRGQVLRDLIPDAYLQALKETNLSPVSEPEVQDVFFQDGQPLRFRTTFEVKPEIQLKRYKGVEVFKEKVIVSDQEVENALRFLQEQAAEYVPMEGWPALRDDLVILDYEASVGGRPLKGRQGKNVSVILGSKAFPPGFEEQVVGLQKGEAKEFVLDVPPDYSEGDLAGKRILFKVIVREVKKRRVPPLDDELARTIGECENLGELRVKVRRDLLAQKEREQEERLKERILEKIALEHPFELPESLVEEEAEDLLAGMRGGLSPGGQDREVELLRSKAREVARKRLRAAFILDAVAEAEGLEVSQEELDQECEVLAASLNQEKATLKAFLERQGRMTELRAQILRRKALDFLFRHAKIVESLNLITLP